MSGVQAFPKPQYDETIPEEKYDEAIPEEKYDEAIPEEKYDEAIPEEKYDEAIPEEKYDEAIPEAEFAKVIKETIPIVQFLSAEDGEAQSMSVEDGETNVIFRILSFLTATFSDSRFNWKWKEDNIRNVFGDLAVICHHSQAIFSNVVPNIAPIQPSQEVTYPTIDWSNSQVNVNTRNLTNLPIPSQSVCQCHIYVLDKIQIQLILICINM